MKSLEQRVQYLEDEAAIRSLTARFSDSVVVGDFDKFKSFWSPDGKWTIHDPFFASATGVLKIDTLLRNLRKEREFFVQFVHSGVIDINGDKAIARWMMREVAKGPAQFYYDNYASGDDEIYKKHPTISWMSMNSTKVLVFANKTHCPY